MNDDLVGIGGLLGCIVLLVLYALAIGAKTKQQPAKPLKPIQPRSIRKTPNSNVVNLTYRRHLREAWNGQERVQSDLILQRGIQIPTFGKNTKNGGTTTIKK